MMNIHLIDGDCLQNLKNKLNYRKDEQRSKQLEQYLNKLNTLGFYLELLPSIEPKFFVEKQGFTIQEALILTRGEDQVRPTNEEILSLEFDDQTDILKLEFTNIIQEGNQNYTYIIILGPPNRGKTTFIFNIINKIFNIQYNSMYRVKKKISNIRGYYDEYYIQIGQNDYVFVDFRGIGDLKLDFLGLDQSGNSNIYIEILKYLQGKKSIGAIFYVNSSSINRLSEDETYCLQRFLELIPKRIITQKKLFFVLTFCTDNQPKMTIYENFTSTPQELKDILNVTNDEEKIWYGINNKPLYERVITYYNTQLKEEESKIQKERNEKINKFFRDIQNQDQCLEPEKDLNDGQQLGQLDNVEDVRIDQEIDESQLGIFQYNLMTNIIGEIINKINKLSNSNDSNYQQYFENKLRFEKDIIQLLTVYKLSTSQVFIIKELNIQEFKTTYLTYEQKDIKEENKKEQQKQKKGSKLLICLICSIQCHDVCRFNNVDDMKEGNMCRMFIQQNDKHDNFFCKKCQKKDISKQCKPKDHILVNDLGQFQKKQKVSMIMLENYQEMMGKMKSNKQSKALYRLQQTAIIKAKLNYQNQLTVINKLIQQQHIENCIEIDLNQRAKYLEAMMNQLKNNNQNDDQCYQKLEEVNAIYKNFRQPDKIAVRDQKEKQEENKEEKLEQKQDEKLEQKEKLEQQQQQQQQQQEKKQQQQYQQQQQQQQQKQSSYQEEVKINQQFESPEKSDLKDSKYFGQQNDQQELIKRK